MNFVTRQVVNWRCVAATRRRIAKIRIFTCTRMYIHVIIYLSVQRVRKFAILHNCKFTKLFMWFHHICVNNHLYVQETIRSFASQGCDLLQICSKQYNIQFCSFVLYSNSLNQNNQYFRLLSAGSLKQTNMLSKIT